MVYSFSTDWAAEIEAVSSLPEFQNATVELIQPATDSVYDMQTAQWSGGSPTLLVATRARVIGIRSPRSVNGDVVSNPTNTLAIRVQFPFSQYPSRISPGVQVRVTDGGRNPALETYLFTVTSDNLSSQRASHTLECTVDLEGVAEWE